MHWYKGNPDKANCHPLAALRILYITSSLKYVLSFSTVNLFSAQQNPTLRIRIYTNSPHPITPRWGKISHPLTHYSVMPLVSFDCLPPSQIISADGPPLSYCTFTDDISDWTWTMLNVWRKWPNSLDAPRFILILK